MRVPFGLGQRARDWRRRLDGLFRRPAARPAQTRLRVASLEDRFLLNGNSLAGSLSPYLPPRHDLIHRGGFLTAPAAGDPRQVAMQFLTAHAADLSLSPADLTHSVVTDQYRDPDTGVTHIYLRQTYHGLEVANANLNINLTADNRVINVGADFVPGLGSGAVTGFAPNPAMAAAQALQGAVSGLGLSLTAPPVVAVTPGGPAEAAVLHAHELSLDPIPAHLHYVATAGGVDLAWNFVMRTPDGDHWYNASVDTNTGTLVAATDWVDHASYNVIALPNESPNDGPRTILTNPNDPTASPYGWHDTNGVAGAEFTDTRGNNVSAQEDGDANDTGGFRPSGGSTLNFDFPLDLSQYPDAYQPAAITQLFYLNNRLHDIHYHYGFTEVTGNFQVNNYGRGGLGNDAVQADAQDGSGYDNANFATPPDGLAPRMQMYIFLSGYPNLDADLDNQVIIHEYGHGVSNRLTGGPANADALNAQQSGGMGEGWSDWWALMLTQRASDTQNQAMPIGTYSLGQPSNGSGFRTYPYSYDMTVDPHTFGDYNYDNEVHSGGELWASALWDMSWLLVDRYGFSANVASGYTGAGSAGNILALKLVMDALKLQPANPTFCEARDAILQADAVLTGGANQDLIWQAFARRGLGVSASCGPDANSTVITEAFDLPPSDPMVIRQSPGTTTRSGPQSFTFVFSEPMNPASFSIAADVVSFTGPGGVDLKPQITGFTWTDSMTLRVNFNRQLNQGSYRMVIGPQILAADNGHAMDQDRDGVPGETADRYAATTSYFLGYRASATPLQAIDLEPGAAGVFTILDGVDDGAAAVNLGGNKFNFFGTTYTGGSSLFVSTNGLITFGSANTNFINTDMTSDPIQAALAPVWQYWTTAADANDQVLGKLEDITGDGVADRLIVEWSHVRLGYYGTGASDVTFQAILQLNTGDTPGTIIFNYPDLDTGESTFTEANGATVGIKDAGSQGDNRLLISYNDFSDPKPLVGSGKAIRIEPSILWPYVASATPVQAINLVPGATGVFSVVDDVDDDTAAVDLGSNTFNFYGTKYSGAAFFASSNGLLTFGSAEGSSGNTDLTFAPNQAAIAPLWDDWRTDLDLNDQVLGKFEDTTGDGVPDRLIIEWNGVQHYATSPSDVTFQVILQLNTGDTPGTIIFNYPDLDTGDAYSNGSAATVGIKDAGSQGDNRLLVSFNDGANPFVGSGKAIRITVGGSITGQVYHDQDGDGVQDSGEPGLAGWTVYLDANNNGVRDTGEVSAVADGSGNYGFTGLAAGTYTVREVLQAGWARTAPVLGAYSITLTGGQAVAGVSFGDAQTQTLTADVIDVTPDPHTTGVSSMQIVFSAPVTGFDLADLSLTRDGGPNLLTTSQTLTTTDNRTFKLGQLGGLTSKAGTYTLTLASTGTGITGSGGIPLAGGASDTFQIIPALKINNVSLTEGNSGTKMAVFTVSLSVVSSQTVTVNFATADGTATAASGDYQAKTGTLTFSPGTKSQKISIIIACDTRIEPDETFFVNLTSPMNATIADSQGLGKILNDDVTAAIADVSAVEGNAGTKTFTFTVRLSAAATFPVSLHFASADGTALATGGDYQAKSGTLTFGPGVTTLTISVLVSGDSVTEPDETFFVKLSSPINATLADSLGLGTILNDDG